MTRPVVEPGWSARFVVAHIPWTREDHGWAGTHCWGGCGLVFRELVGIELPPYGPAADRHRNAAMFAEGRRISCAVDVTSKALRTPAERRPLDIVVFEVGGIDDHCGLVVEPDLMLHWSERRGVGWIDRISRWGRLSGVYRHEALA